MMDCIDSGAVSMSQVGMWVFEELRGAAVRRDPNEGVLFKSEQAGEGEYAGNDALVREIIQNALDARSGHGPVRVRLAIHEPDAAPDRVRLAHYFARLREPLQPRGVEFNGHQIPVIPCRFLVCEDFGTRGLSGDILQFKDPPNGSVARQDFYWFWRNIGRSGKTGDDLGRWGLGKSVYRSVSRTGCMFGLTIRKEDQKRYLMGQAVLHIHQKNSTEYQPEGYWCAKQGMDGLPLPIDDESELQRFCREWKLTRRDEPGLSVVSPFAHPDLKPELVLQAVLVHFFLRILRGELVVEVASGSQVIRVDQDSIGSVCESVTWNGLKRDKRHVAPPIEFSRACLQSPPGTISLLLGSERIPEMTEAAFHSGELNLARRAFAAGELTSLRIRLWLPLRDGSGSEGHMDVYLQRKSDTERCDTYYVREGMTITRLNSRTASRGIAALVVVDSGPLAELLGDTEGPAHEDWQTSAERPDRKWKTWKGRVTFARKIVDSIVELLTPPETEPDFDSLSEFFSVDRTGQQRGRKPGQTERDRPEFKEISVTPKWYTVMSRAGGFTLKRNLEVPRPAATALKISVAYDIPRGDPLRSWSAFDFKVSRDKGDIQPKGSGAAVLFQAGNIIILRIDDEDFRCSLDGFDLNRDLFVRVDEVPEPGAEE